MQITLEGRIMSLVNNCQAFKLRTEYAQFHKNNPNVRIRTAAHALGVSELELVAASAGTISSTPLRGPVQDILKLLGSLERVMALSRNDWAVHERYGKYEDVHAGNTMGIALGADIDLRFFFKHWGTAWAVSDQGRRSIQFFDTGGTAIHKVFCTEETNVEAYDKLVNQFTDYDAPWPVIVAIDSDNHNLANVAPQELRKRWMDMNDIHQFHRILKDLNVSRLTAFRGAGKDLAQRVDNEVVEKVLESVVQKRIPLMCFVGNTGIVQIHSGTIQRLLRTGPWLNILDPIFNLHLDTTAIKQSWLVSRPTSDGWVTSLECFAASGDLVVQFFGARKPGNPELKEWRDLLSSHAIDKLAA